MAESILKEKSFEFAVHIVKLAQWLQREKSEYILSKQILRSGTAIGALVSEAFYAQSKPDFISKMSIALKEANETHYWLKLLHATEIIDLKLYESMINSNTELLALLISSVRTAKRNHLQ